MLLVAASLFALELTVAQSIPKPSIPEFLITYKDDSYDIQASTSIDPFTGKTLTNPAQHIQNETIQIAIKNQTIPFGFLYYDVRIRGPFSGNWTDIAHVQANPFSEYTVLTYALEGNNASGNFGGNLKISSSGGIVEFQVQAQVWHYEQSDGLFKTWYLVLADSSDWSGTTTVTFTNGLASISTSSNQTGVSPSTQLPSSSPLNSSPVPPLQTPTNTPIQSVSGSPLFGSDWVGVALVVLPA